MDKMLRHKGLCDELKRMYAQKNKAYGDSFSETFSKLGIISAVTSITHKYNRLVNLATHNNIDDGDESMIDTLLDMANYCLMTVMEVEPKEASEPEWRSLDGITSSVVFPADTKREESVVTKATMTSSGVVFDGYRGDWLPELNEEENACSVAPTDADTAIWG